MIQRYIINKPSAIVTVDGIAEGKAIAIKWCKSEDVGTLEVDYQKLLEAHRIMKQALEWMTTDGCLIDLVDYLHMSKRELAVKTLQRVNEVMQ